MKALAALCCTAALAFGIAGCNGNTTPPAAAPDTHDADVKAISDSEVQWVNEWASKDADKVTAHYADDAAVMAPGMAPMQGKDSIHKGVQEMLKDPGLMLQFKSARVDVSGSLGYSQGSYTMKMTDPKTHKVVEDHGSYVTTYRKQADGSWKAVMDIASSEMPPMPMPSPMKMKKM